MINKCWNLTCTLALALAAGSAAAQIQFEDATDAAGLNFVTETWGASWGHMNGDARPDLFVNNHRNHPSLYISNNNGGFDDRAAALDVSDTWETVTNADTHGASWADFDNDGDQDLYVSSGSEDLNQFFINENGVLRDHTQTYDPLIADWRGRQPIWFDYSDDGLLDFAMASQNEVETFEQSSGSSGFRTTTSETRVDCVNAQAAVLADVAGNDRLELLCIGTTAPTRIYGTDSLPFSDYTSVIPTTDLVQDVVVADLDNDLNVDFFAVRGPKRLSGASLVSSRRVESQVISEFTTEKTLSFVTSGDITISLATEYLLDAGMVHIGGGDLHPDEPVVNRRELTFTLSAQDPAVTGWVAHDPATDQGIYIGYTASTNTWRIAHTAGGLWHVAYTTVDSTSAISNVSFDGLKADEYPQAPRLLRQEANGFIDRTAATGLETPISCISAASGDFDNDMDVDLYLACRGAVENLPNILYENQGDGTFVALPASAGAQGYTGFGVGKSESVVVADYDLDGFLDLFITNGMQIVPFPPNDTGGPHNLLRNKGNANHWVEVDLVGTTANRDGIGAKVYASVGGVTQVREQNGGYHRWSQNAQRLHFGLKENNRVNLTVVWPAPASNTETFTNVPADRLYRITQGFGIEVMRPNGTSPVSMSIADVEVSEADGTATFNVRLSKASSSAVSVDVATIDRFATAGKDYIQSSATLSFTPGQTSKQFSVALIDDLRPEDKEGFGLSLSNAVNAVLVDTLGVASITDNDAPASVGDTPACGDPDYDKATESGVYIWQACDSDLWFLRAVAGGETLSYSGVLISDQPFTSLTPRQLETTDLLQPAAFSTPTEGPVEFEFNVSDEAHDGADFGFAAGSETCVGVHTPRDIPVWIGANWVPAGDTINLTDFGSCAAARRGANLTEEQRAAMLLSTILQLLLEED